MEFIYGDLEKEAETKGLVSEGLSFGDFVDIVLKMRGRNPATVKDIKELTRNMKMLMGKVQESIMGFRKKVTTDMGKMASALNKDHDDDRSNPGLNFDDDRRDDDPNSRLSALDCYRLAGEQDREDKRQDALLRAESTP